MELTFRIEGITPLLMNSPAGMLAPREQNVGRKVNPTPEEDAELSAYRLPSQQFYLPSSAFRACLLAAAKGRRIGKVAATTVIKGAVFVVTENTPIYNPDDGTPATEYEIDVRRAVIPTGKQAIPRARPKVAKWGAEVILDIDTEFVTEENIRQLFAIGGRTIGVGSYRPEKSGPFGRFRLVES